MGGIGISIGPHDARDLSFLFLPCMPEALRRAVDQMQRKPLYSCAVYISSGLSSVASRAASAASAASSRVAVVDTFTDAAYARSSVKLVAEPEHLLCAAEAAAAAALDVVDLTQEPHPAPHPRQGAVDMVSFMPLTEQRASVIGADLATCDELAWQLGQRLGEAHGVPVLMYGPRAGRTLLETRRGTSFFRSTRAGSMPAPTTTLSLDFGPGTKAAAGAVGGEDSPLAEGVAEAALPELLLPPRLGASIIGVQTYVTNFNVCVEGGTLEACRSAASALRSRYQVQVMALPHEGETHEIGCNLQASEDLDSPSREDVLACLREHLPTDAAIRHSYVIGLAPDEALRKGAELLA